MSSFHEAMRDDIADALRRGIEDGSVRPDIDPDGDALFVVALVRGLDDQWVLDPDTVDLVVADGRLAGLL